MLISAKFGLVEFLRRFSLLYSLQSLYTSVCIEVPEITGKELAIVGMITDIDIKATPQLHSAYHPQGGTL